MTNEEFCNQICDVIKDAFGNGDYGPGSIAEVINDAFKSNNELSLTDAVEELANSQSKIALAITAGCSEGTDATGGKVLSLTEAVMGVTSGLCKIADAISDLAEAIRKN